MNTQTVAILASLMAAACSSDERARVPSSTSSESASEQATNEGEAPPLEERFADARRALVDHLRGQGIQDERVLNAIAAVLTPRTQELVRVRRIDADRVERETLGRVQFVPLVGAEGWTDEGAVATPPRERAPLREDAPDAGALGRLIAERAERVEDIERVDLGPLLERIGDAKVVLIGEASHGTSEFYRMRARITRALIQQKGFTVVGIEGDWPDVSVLDRRVRGRDPIELREGAFTRFPTWMWRNRETLRFLQWLAAENEGRDENARVSLHGLDVYGLHNAIGLVLDYLEEQDPDAARAARTRYGCFSPWETDPAVYGRIAMRSEAHRCEDAAVAQLRDLVERRVEGMVGDGDSYMDAERAATVVKNAERYYRVMYYGGSESWNLRDRHMEETLEAVRAHRGPDARAVVWAHNSHIGNAAATEMGVRGEINIGQLARERHGRGAYLIGFGTHRGTVAAASGWDAPMQRMTVDEINTGEDGRYRRHRVLTR